MESKIKVKREDVVRLYECLERVHDLFHQPLKYQDQKVVSAFADENYKEISDLYYDTLWEYLPADIRQKIENE